MEIAETTYRSHSPKSVFHPDWRARVGRIHPMNKGRAMIAAIQHAMAAESDPFISRMRKQARERHLAEYVN